MILVHKTLKMTQNNCDVHDCLGVISVKAYTQFYTKKEKNRKYTHDITLERRFVLWTLVKTPIWEQKAVASTMADMFSHWQYCRGWAYWLNFVQCASSPRNLNSFWGLSQVKQTIWKWAQIHSHPKISKLITFSTWKWSILIVEI